LYRALGWQSGMQFRASTRLHNRAKPARLPQWPADHLAVYDKSQPARCQPVEVPGRGVDRAAVDVVGQDDAALMGVLQDAVGDDARTRAAPVLWIHRPQNCRQGPCGVQPCALITGKCAVGRAKGQGRATDNLKGGITGAVNFVGDG
jgi:hypothetical protein